MFCKKVEPAYKNQLDHIEGGFQAQGVSRFQSCQKKKANKYTPAFLELLGVGVYSYPDHVSQISFNLPLLIITINYSWFVSGSSLHGQTRCSFCILCISKTPQTCSKAGSHPVAALSSCDLVVHVNTCTNWPKLATGWLLKLRTSVC